MKKEFGKAELKEIIESFSYNGESFKNENPEGYSISVKAGVQAIAILQEFGAGTGAGRFGTTNILNSENALIGGYFFRDNVCKIYIY